MNQKVEAILQEAEVRMERAISALQAELNGIRTGRASPALIEHLHVEAYGVSTPLQQLASITVPEARMLLITPWDKSIVGAIEKAILKSDLGLNPTNDGRAIRVVIPFLSEERRRELIKVVHHKVEEGRVAVRNCRRDALEQLEKMVKDKENPISEDEFKRSRERLQKETDAHILRVESIGEAKEEEILEI